VSRFVGLVDRAEGLYESVVTSAHDWNESRFAEWADELAVDGADLDRDTLRFVRRIIRAAAKLQTFWAVDDTTRPDDHGDWRTRVDISLGARAWRPILELAMHGLEVDPSPELFEVVRQLFVVVNAQRWMDGVSYEDWLSGR
jgi:hypothetical protein